MNAKSNTINNYDPQLAADNRCPGPRTGERFLYWTLCSISKELFAFFLPDLKSRGISSLWTFFSKSCGLRRKTKAVMVWGPFWPVQKHLINSRLSRWIQSNAAPLACACLRQSVTRSLPLCSAQQTGVHLLSGWAGLRDFLLALVRKSKLAADWPSRLN